MKVETYKCDVCGKQKGDVNHWWFVRTGVDPEFGKVFGLLPWSPQALSSEADGVEQASEFHLCGAECVQKTVSEFLSK